MFFRKKDKTVNIPLSPKPGEEDRSRFAGDPQATKIVHDLLDIPPEKRGSQWEEALLAHLADANLDGGFDRQPREITGPDGLPYIRLDSPKPNVPYQAWVIRHILPNLLEHACGVVINPEKGEPDWVLSFGDIVNLHLNGAFLSDDGRFERYNADAPGSETVAAGGETILTGAPSSDILPPQVRAVLGRFLQAYGFPPRVLLMSREANPQAGRTGGLSLVFPFTEKNEQDEETIQYVTRAVSWFLPRHYTVIWMRENGNFVDL